MKTFWVTLKSKDIYEVTAKNEKQATEAVLFGSMFQQPGVTIKALDVDNHNTISVDEVNKED